MLSIASISSDEAAGDERAADGTLPPIGSARMGATEALAPAPLFGAPARTAGTAAAFAAAPALASAGAAGAAGAAASVEYAEDVSDDAPDDASDDDGPGALAFDELNVAWETESLDSVVMVDDVNVDEWREEEEEPGPGPGRPLGSGTGPRGLPRAGLPATKLLELGGSP